MMHKIVLLLTLFAGVLSCFSQQSAARSPAGATIVGAPAECMHMIPWKPFRTPNLQPGCEGDTCLAIC